MVTRFLTCGMFANDLSAGHANGSLQTHCTSASGTVLLNNMNTNSYFRQVLKKYSEHMLFTGGFQCLGMHGAQGIGDFQRTEIFTTWFIGRKNKHLCLWQHKYLTEHQGSTLVVIDFKNLVEIIQRQPCSSQRDF